ncbi:MAG: hypothetical protein HZB67_02810, partial [Candidatus Aenigmarchaeota archaeon]|nr:hypothetical protein [Candidatus Aenigmarchaeota archaeon]
MRTISLIKASFFFNLFWNSLIENTVLARRFPKSNVTFFSASDNSFEISGLPNEIQNLPEAQLDAKCRSSVSASFCRTGADFSVTADGQGNFKFERVDLTVIFGGAARFREVPVTELRDTQLNPEAQESKRTTLVVIATDQTGQRGVATQTVNIGTCWSGNQSWDIVPLTQYQSPTLLSAERLAEGTETIYFYFNYSYVGFGTGAKITSVNIAKACSNRELLDPRYNISCQLLGGFPAILVNPPDNTISYTAATLSRLPGMDRFLEKDWNAFFKAVNKELTFPVKVMIKYQHDKDNDGRLESEVQTTCEQVSYVLDNSLINFRNVLPDWLLFDFVDILQDSIKTITDVQEKLNKVLEFITIGCVTSFGLVFIVGAYRRIVEFADEKTYLFLTAAKDINEGISKLTEIFQKNPLKTANNKEDERTYCKDLLQKIYEDKKTFKLKYLSDADLRKCFPNSASAWQAEENVYKSMRYTCDRVFGHSSPAGWTESKNDADIQAKVSSASGCAVDQSERGQPLRFTSCRELSLSQYGLKPGDFEVEDKCYELRIDNPNGGFRRILLQLGQPVQGTTNIYEVTQKTKDREVLIRFAKKLNEKNYLTAAQKSCEELCGVKQTGKEEVIVLENQQIGLNPKEVPKPKPGEQPKKPKKTGFGCITVDKCRGLNQNKKIGNEEIEYAYPAGYAFSVSDQIKTPCFYNGDRPSVVSDNPAERQECCCINTKGEIITHYYQPEDVYAIKGLENIPVHEAKTESTTASPVQEPPKIGSEDFAKMKWSYRYYKEKFEAVNPKNPSVVRYEYNPNRYMEARDWPACFGQDSWWDGKNVVIVNPSRDHLASVQCINLGGISARLQIIKNLMAHLSSCLVQVRTTGRGDTGTCKELFSQYVCSGIWQAIRWIIDGCSPFAFDYGKTIQDTDIIEYLAKGAKGVHDSVSDLQRTIASEYGNAKLNELLGFGEESLARKVCLLAFGYDWELDFKSFVDAAYTTPFATLVQPVTRSREFLTVEPHTSKPKYEYRASWLINPGCDFERYEVWLSCVGKQQLDKYSNSVNCAALGAPSVGYTVPLGTSTAFSQCDCLNLPNEKSELVFAGKLKQNVLEDNVIPSGIRVLTTDVRYDHLKIVLKPDRKVPQNVKQNCFPTGFDDGVFYYPLIDKTARDILDCQADLSQGLFLCKDGQIFRAKKGTASFLDLWI